MAPNNLLDRLVAFEPTPFPVISVYLNTQTDHHGRDNFDAFVRRELKAQAKRWGMRTPERESFDRDAERINDYLRDELRPSSNGAAIFACSAEGDFFEAVQFVAPIEENQLFTSAIVFHLLYLKNVQSAAGARAPEARLPPAGRKVSAPCAAPKPTTAFQTGRRRGNRADLSRKAKGTPSRRAASAPPFPQRLIETRDSPARLAV